MKQNYVTVTLCTWHPVLGPRVWWLKVAWAQVTIGRRRSLTSTSVYACFEWRRIESLERVSVWVGQPYVASLSLYHDRDVYVTTRRCIATALGRFAHLYCSLAGNDSYASREEVRAAGRR